MKITCSQKMVWAKECYFNLTDIWVLCSLYGARFWQEMELAIDAVEIEYINLNIVQKFELNLTLLRANIFDYLMPGKRSGVGWGVSI